jgi:hypothetical protein
MNVIASPGGSSLPERHPSGAHYVTVSPGTLVPLRAPDGSMYINPSGGTFKDSGLPVTGFGITSPVPVTFQAESTLPAGSGTATRTWAAVAIGTASATRFVIASLSVASAGLTISSATIGGVTAAVSQVSSGNSLAAFISAVVPTGTTADFVVNYSGTDFSANKLESYTCDSSLLNSQTPTVGFHADAAGGGTTATATVSTTGKANGFILTIGTAFGATAGPTVGSSTDTVTVDGSSIGTLATHVNAPTVTSSWSMTINWTTASSADVLALAVYR